MKTFMSPVIGRRSLAGSPAVGRKRNGLSRDDESHLLQSPTDCEANEMVNGKGGRREKDGGIRQEANV